jgi:hypothetical protein
MVGDAGSRAIQASRTRMFMKGVANVLWGEGGVAQSCWAQKMAATVSRAQLAG